MVVLLRSSSSKSLALTGISIHTKENCFLSKGGSKVLYLKFKCFSLVKHFAVYYVVSVNSSSLSRNRMSSKFATKILKVSQKGEV